MPNGTVINRVFAPRIHKSNADAVVNEADGMIRHYSELLLVKAAMTPSPDCLEGINSNVMEIIEELEGEVIKRFMAQQIIDFPEDCEDELEIPSD
jgi:hypothetical protein